MRKPNALLLAALGLLALLYPLALVGAVLTIGYWIVRRSPNWHRNLFAFAGAGVGVLMGGYIPIWSAADTAASLVGQALAGGLYALGIQRSGILDPPATLPAQPTAEGPAPDRRDHPGAGQSARTEANGDRRYLELGRHAGSVVRVELREEGTFHISVLGEPGSGKTTTLVRIAHDYLAAGRPLVIVDGKGSGSLREAAEGLAEMHGIPFRLLDPHDPRTLGYNPATGSSADVTNKLVGAFRFSADAEVYRQVSQRVLPLLVKALREADSPVTVRRLAKALDPRVLGGDHIKERGGEAGRQLAALDTSRNNLIPVSLVGMQSRLYALLEGHYGELFDPREGREDLDVNAALGSGVTYVALSTLAASEDTELMARVLAQDFKQATAARLRRMRSEGHPPPFALLAFDEFAAYEEAEQLRDLLLQARESRVSVAISSQLLPESSPLRKTMLTAGLLVCHAVGPEDARRVAPALGERKAVRVSRGSHEDADEAGRMHPFGGIEDRTDRRESVSWRSEDTWEIGPDELSKLGVGEAVLRTRHDDRARRVRRVRVERVRFPEKEGETA
jgi:hypothetical protein